MKACTFQMDTRCEVRPTRDLDVLETFHFVDWLDEQTMKVKGYAEEAVCPHCVHVLKERGLWQYVRFKISTSPEKGLDRS